jgi:hypothetical protein
MTAERTNDSPQVPAETATSPPRRRSVDETELASSVANVVERERGPATLGEDVVLSDGRRVLGQDAGLFEVPEDFDEPLSDALLAAFGSRVRRYLPRRD